MFSVASIIFDSWGNGECNVVHKWVPSWNSQQLAKKDDGNAEKSDEEEDEEKKPKKEGEEEELEEEYEEEEIEEVGLLITLNAHFHVVNMYERKILIGFVSPFRKTTTLKATSTTARTLLPTAMKTWTLRRHTETLCLSSQPRNLKQVCTM